MSCQYCREEEWKYSKEHIATVIICTLTNKECPCYGYESECPE